MDTKKKLFEAKGTDPEIDAFIKSPLFQTHPFVTAWMKNYPKHLEEAGEPEIGQLRGQTVGDATGAGAGMQVAATLEIFNAVIRGFTRYMDDTFVRKYVTDKVIFKIPKTEYRELAGAIGTPAAGQLPHSEKTIDYATVDLSSPESEKGAKCTWTRALLEDITFDVQAEMAEGLGHAIATLIMIDILAKLQAVDAYRMPTGAKINITDTAITWSEFLSVVSAVDVGVDYLVVPFDAAAGTIALGAQAINQTDGAQVLGYVSDVVYTSASAGVIYIHQTLDKGDIPADNEELYCPDVTHKVTVAAGAAVVGTRTYGPADFVLVSTDLYWQLLNIIQMTNVLYEGSTDPVKAGVIRLALGCTITKQSLLPAHTIIALNSAKAIGLVTRRQLKIEPVLFPVWNEYGFIGTVRYGATIIYPSAIQIGD